jgi:hypothetical protein
VFLVSTKYFILVELSLACANPGSLPRRQEWERIWHGCVNQRGSGELSVIDPTADSQLVFDLGHRGDVDLTQIAKLLALSPTERLNRHERWRLFVKEALANAALRQGDSIQ